MASVSISCPSCSATDGVVRNLARLGRKSLSFSKSVELHDKVIGHYLNIKHYQ
ncbi:IS1 family transposase [Escherichia coli]|uniref:IS1 family transposase n=1 Tax=Escherichia coli TaxID=562 RepID=UPI001C6FD221|nr:IS1 family transposase [Escherichia coli]MBW9354763.1 hypothetical protein [Escherichia coli]MBW9394835.1 hypothetical protein [Escherichia coli]MBW9404616.1 hypothetical protein [Escherichia coli]MBW9406653.1 hypothetical protein [Escherichia coli]MBW9479575.1 hypothetical protein [Escherichia coli]